MSSSSGWLRLNRPPRDAFPRQSPRAPSQEGGRSPEAPAAAARSTGCSVDKPSSGRSQHEGWRCSAAGRVFRHVPEQFRDVLVQTRAKVFWTFRALLFWSVRFSPCTLSVGAGGFSVGGDAGASWFKVHRPGAPPALHRQLASLDSVDVLARPAASRASVVHHFHRPSALRAAKKADTV